MTEEKGIYTHRERKGQVCTAQMEEVSTRRATATNSLFLSLRVLIQNRMRNEVHENSSVVCKTQG